MRDTTLRRFRVDKGKRLPRAGDALHLGLQALAASAMGVFVTQVLFGLLL